MIGNKIGVDLDVGLINRYFLLAGITHLAGTISQFKIRSVDYEMVSIFKKKTLSFGVRPAVDSHNVLTVINLFLGGELDG